MLDDADSLIEQGLVYKKAFLLKLTAAGLLYASSL